jgi:hypothetical protein
VDLQSYMMKQAENEAIARDVLFLTKFQFANTGTIYVKTADGTVTLNAVTFSFQDGYVTLDGSGGKHTMIKYAKDAEMATFLPFVFANCPHATAVGRSAAAKKARTKK